MAEVQLETNLEMAADAEGLVHGGFLFCLADYAAMLAVNDPLVVLSKAQVEFLKPVVVGETLLAKAELIGLDKESAGHRPRVACTVSRGGETVFTGEFHCAIPRRHVLSPKETTDPTQTKAGGGKP